MTQVLSNYKVRISLILFAGFVIVSIITSIAAFAIYQSVLFEYKTEANKIIKLFENNYKNILKDIRYLQLIDYQASDQEILKKFQEVSQIIYEKNHFINGIALVKQFQKEDLEKENQNFSKLLKKDIEIFPLVDLIKGAKAAKEDDLYSAMLYRTPLKMTKDLIGSELSSEHNRQVIIASMNFTDKYYLTAPVMLVNDGFKGYKYSSILYYPLYKKQGDDYYKWFVTIPMTSQKVLNAFLKEYFYFKDFNIQVFDRSDNLEEEYVCICQNKNIKDSLKKTAHIIATHTFHFANRDRRMVISVDSLFILEKYWTVILGFISGIIFLSAIGYYLFFKEQKELQVRQLSRTDHLTKVYNRIYFDEQIEYFLEQFKRYEQNFSVVLIDIDDFKNINDTYGHVKGDEVLVMLTKVLSPSIRKSDMLARWGGRVCDPFTKYIIRTESKNSR